LDSPPLFAGLFLTFIFLFLKANFLICFFLSIFHVFYCPPFKRRRLTLLPSKSALPAVVTLHGNFLPSRIAWKLFRFLHYVCDFPVLFFDGRRHLPRAGRFFHHSLLGILQSSSFSPQMSFLEKRLPLTHLSMLWLLSSRGKTSALRRRTYYPNFFLLFPPLRFIFVIFLPRRC